MKSSNSGSHDWRALLGFARITLQPPVGDTPECGRGRLTAVQRAFDRVRPPKRTRTLVDDDGFALLCARTTRGALRNRDDRDPRREAPRAARLPARPRRAAPAPRSRGRPARRRSATATSPRRRSRPTCRSCASSSAPHPTARRSLVHRSGGYLLEIAADALDATRFEAAVAAASVEPDAPARLASLVDALALWRGPPLDEFAGLAWADDLARQWTRMYVLAQQLRARRAARRRQPSRREARARKARVQPSAARAVLGAADRRALSLRRAGRGARGRARGAARCSHESSASSPAPRSSSSKRRGAGARPRPRGARRRHRRPAPRRPASSGRCRPAS